MHRHNNMDHSMLMAIPAAENIFRPGQGASAFAFSQT